MSARPRSKAASAAELLPCAGEGRGQRRAAVATTAARTRGRPGVVTLTRTAAPARALVRARPARRGAREEWPEKVAAYPASSVGLLQGRAAGRDWRRISGHLLTGASRAAAPGPKAASGRPLWGAD